jgi:hypothetical protein
MRSCRVTGREGQAIAPVASRAAIQDEHDTMNRTRLLSLALVGGIAVAQQPVEVSSALQAVCSCFDDARQRLVFPQTDGSIQEWDGVRWGKVGASAAAPLVLVAYEPVRQRVYGRAGTRMVEFDGHAFVDRGPWPAGSRTGTLVADRQGGLLHLRGVGLGGVAFDRWNGTGWQSLPGPAGGSFEPLATAFDVARGVLVAQFARLGSGISYEVWEWGGGAWSLRLANDQLRVGLGYDAANQRVVSIAGGTAAWTGSAWLPLPTQGGPTQVTSVAADVANERIWAWGQGQGARHEVWSFDGSAWTAMPAPHPVVLLRPIVFDPVRGRAMLFGFEPSVQGNVHSEWDGERWVEIRSAGAPAPRSRHAMAFDVARGNTLVFGGEAAAGLLRDTWTWNGAVWQSVANSGPSARRRAAMAYDAANATVVLVGGETAAGPIADHWEWDGVAWSQRSVATPMGAVLGMLGVDDARQRTVFVDALGRTWEFDGVNWLQVAVGGPRAQGDETALVWDTVAQRLVGNLLDAQSQPRRFGWDGTVWTDLGAHVGQLAFDTRRGTLLACGAEGMIAYSSTPAAVQYFGAPCGGVGTNTSLSSFGSPRVGTEGLHLDLRAAATLRPAMIGYALQSGSLSLGGSCRVYLDDPFASTVWFTDQFGYWHRRVGLPSVPALRGLQVFAQGAVLDPASPGSLALSQGVALTIGD